MGDDIPDKGVPVDNPVGFRGIAQDNYDQVLGGDNEDFLAVVTLAVEHVLGNVRPELVLVQPEERAVAVLAVGGRGDAVVHPAFGEDPPALEDAVIQSSKTALRMPSGAKSRSR